MKNSVPSTKMTSLYGFQASPVVFWIQNSDFRTKLTSLYGSQASSVDLCTHIRVISTRISSLYEFQLSLVVLCMQNGDFRNRITSLYGSQTSPVVFEGKRVNLVPELQVSMCPSPHLWIFHAKQRL